MGGFSEMHIIYFYRAPGAHVKKVKSQTKKKILTADRKKSSLAERTWCTGKWAYVVSVDVYFVVLFYLFSFSAVKFKKKLTVQLSNIITWFHLEIFILLQNTSPLGSSGLESFQRDHAPQTQTLRLPLLSDLWWNWCWRFEMMDCNWSQ